LSTLEDSSKQARVRFLIVMAISFVVMAFVAALSYANFVYTKNNAIERTVYTELPWLSQKIEAQIDATLAPPIAVSKEMANDPWLRKWVVDGEKELPAITQKLASIKNTHNALTSFVVVDKSSKYYNEGGLHKLLNPSKDPHDAWFEGFKKYAQTQEYEVTADTSQANKDKLSIFINYAMRTDDKAFAAAVGLGFTIDDFGKKIKEFKGGRDDIRIWLVDEAGNIKVSEDPSQIMITSDNSGKHSLKSLFGEQNAKSILDHNGSVVKIDSSGTKYVVARYIKDLKWHIVAKIDEDSIVSGLNKEFLRNEAIFSIFILILAAIGVWQYNRSWMLKYIMQEHHRRQEDMLVRQSRMASLGEMLDMVAHQWKQPLGALSMSMQELKLMGDIGELDTKGVIECANVNIAIIGDMNATLEDFRGFFNPDKQKNIFYVKDAAQKVASVLKSSLLKHHITVEINIDDKLSYYGVANELQQVLLSLVVNAKEILESRDVASKLVVIDADVNGEELVLHVADNAGGIPEGFLEKIFEPRFSLKNSGGTGVGLYMARLIVEESFQGRIWAQNKDDGALFTIVIPIQNASAL